MGGQSVLSPNEVHVRSVLIVRSAFGEIYEFAWLRALRELGVRADLFDTHSYIPSNIAGRLQQRYLWGPHIDRVNRLVVERVEQTRPDVVVFYHGHHYRAQTIAEIAKRSFVCGSHCDDPFGRPHLREYRLLIKALPEYDGYHVNRERNIREAMCRGVKRARVLMMYYIPWIHYPCRLNVPEQTAWGSDVVYAGHMEPDHRIECLSSVVRNGFKCRIYGGEVGWRTGLPESVYRVVQPIPNVRGDDYRRVLCASKIAACFFSKWNRDQYTNRSWEIPACGAFLLSERTPAMQEFYTEGKEAEFFDTPEEFIDKVRFYLGNETARMRIAAAGYARVLKSGNDIYSRMRQWLADIEEWRSERRDQESAIPRQEMSCHD